MKKYLTILLVACLFSSCGDWLELLPNNEQVTAEYWKTKEDVEAVVASGYYYMRETTPYLIDWGELRGASVTYLSTGDKAKLQNFQMLATNKLSSWSVFYQVINMANSVITYAPQVAGVDLTYTEAAVRSHQAEAYFMRALMYFYLVRNFKEVPLVLEPYVDDNAPFAIEKSTDQQILAQIRDDLTVAIESGAAKEFYESPTWNASKGRATVWALYALMAEVSLWAEDYDNCVLYANKLIEATATHRPAFMSVPEQWFSMFNPGNSNESIFELNWDSSTYSQTAKSPSEYYKFDVGGTATTLMPYAFSEAMTQRLYAEAAEVKAGGLVPVRTEFGALAPIGLNSAIGLVALVWKYMGTEVQDVTVTRLNAGGSTVANYILYRMADVMLMKAEALIWKGPENWLAALDILNQIRLRSNLPPLNPTLSEETEASMLRLVLNERDIELAAEGKRWYDLVRFGKSKNFAHRNEFIEIVVENNSSINDSWLRSVLRNENAWYLPISEAEIANNDLLVQNPYYAITQ